MITQAYHWRFSSWKVSSKASSTASDFATPLRIKQGENENDAIRNRISDLPASLIVERKFTVFACFYFVFEGNFPSTSPRGAYIWRGLFSELYGISEGFLKFCYLISNLILGQIIDSNPTNVHKLAA